MTADTLTASVSAASGTRSFRHLFVRGVSYKLLLAIEPDDNAPAAIHFTDALAARGAVPGVLRSLEMMVPVGGVPETTILFAEAALGADFYEDQERILASTIHNVLGADRGWPISTVVGDPPATIIDEAKARGAELLVVGIHHHGRLAQVLGENTATRVMAKAGIPVIGVRRGTMELPRRIMVATDFGDASIEAAHLAANLADPDGTVTLVHVKLPSYVVEEGDEGAVLVQREGIEHAFLHLSAEIGRGKTIRVETVTRTGDAGTELLAAAEQINPDMITVAGQRHGLVTRVLLGSVSRKLVRDGHWSMLVTPPTRAD